MSARWHDVPMTAVDTETTGKDPLTARIVTACAIHIDVGADGAELDTWTWLLNPGVEIPAEATDVHGITTERAQAEGQDYADGYAELRASIDNAWADGRAVVVYNAAYDLTLLDAEGRRLGWPPLQPGLVIDPLVIDRGADRYRRGKRTLTAVCDHYGVTLGGAHDATQDALAAARIAWRMPRRIPALADVTADDLMARQTRWHAEWADHFADYLRSQGKPADDVSGQWPIRTPQQKDTAAA